ncbi:MAG: tetratricopeptide repeat protein [Candidatus Coatesbacteria bacterium]|nr:tetratricopeptide repeat protein [Candidatus Coatesbacteria bacterium]
MVKRTIKVKKKVKSQDQAVPKDLLTHAIDFARDNGKFIAFAALAVAVVLALVFGYKSYDRGRLEGASQLEYQGADLYNQAMDIDLTVEDKPTDEEQEPKKPIAERLAERRSLLEDSLAKFKELKANYSGSPSLERAIFYIGIIHFELGDYRSAIAAFEEYLKEYPDGNYDALCRANLAKTQEELGELDDATKTYKELLEKHEGAMRVAPYYFSLAEIYENNKQLDSAKDIYTKVATLYPGSQWQREADSELKRIEGPDASGVPGAPGMGADMSKLPPGFDPSKVQRVVVGGDKDGERTISVDTAGADDKPAANEADSN